MASKPVTDWTTDFDHTDPRWIDNPAPIIEDIRSKCPVAHTDRFLGVYLTTTYQGAREVTLNTKAFSSRRVVVRDTRPDYLVPAPPVTLDPPQHTPIKQMLLPPFSLETARRIEPRIRATCQDLLDDLMRRPLCDAGQDYARHVSARTMTHLLGVPEKDSDLLLKWIHEIFDLGVTNDKILMKAVGESQAYFGTFFEPRRARGEDDLITLLVNARMNGEPLPDAFIQATLRAVMMAGIDTTICSIAAAIWHLAKTPIDRKKLLDRPELLPNAIDEILRAYPPVTLGREVMEETVVEGCPMKPGNMVLVSLLGANRDPKVFSNPNKVDLERSDANKHLAFGFGVHRCIAAHLGRSSMTIAVEEWLKHIPNFSLNPDLPVIWNVGQIRGPQILPVLLR